MQIYGQNIFGQFIEETGVATGEMFAFLNSIINAELSVTSYKRLSDIYVVLHDSAFISGTISTNSAVGNSSSINLPSHVAPSRSASISIN